MRRLVPFCRFRLVPEISPSAFAARLEKEIGAGKEGAFEGSFDKEGFIIGKIRRYRSTSMPRVTGRILEEDGKSAVEITMRPHREVLIFASVWFFFLTLFTALIIFFSLDGELVRIFFAAIPLGLFVSSWLLLLRVFESDCRWTREALQESLFQDP